MKPTPKYHYPKPSSRWENVALWAIMVGTVIASCGVLYWIVNN